LVLGVEPAEAEPDRRVRELVADPERFQHVRRLERRRRAGRARRHRDVLETHEQRLALDEGEAQVQVAGQTLHRMAVQVHLVELAHDALAQALAEPEQALVLALHHLAADLHRLPETDDARDVERARTEAALLAAAVELRAQPHAWIARADVERADA